jgi:hypothetical protein
MAKKETFEEFFKKWHTFDERIVREAIGDWNSNTLLAMSKSQYYSPVKTGANQGSARRLKAQIDRGGIKSAYIFTMPYSFDLERGYSVRGGKRTKAFNINTTINPNAQIGYGKRGADEQEPEFMRDLSKSIDKAFNQI